MNQIIEKYFNNIGIYIDNSNFLNTLKELTGNKDNKGSIIDYSKLVAFILNQLKKQLNFRSLFIKLVRIYDGLAIDNRDKMEKKKKFLHSVSQRIKNKFPKTRVIPRVIEFNLGSKNRKIKGDDTLMASDIIYDIFTRKCDFVVIVSGDGDFLPVINIVKNQTRIPTIIAFFNKNLNHNLRYNADIFIELQPNEIELISQSV